MRFEFLKWEEVGHGTKRGSVWDTSSQYEFVYSTEPPMLLHLATHEGLVEPQSSTWKEVEAYIRKKVRKEPVVGMVKGSSSVAIHPEFEGKPWMRRESNVKNVYGLHKTTSFHVVFAGPPQRSLSHQATQGSEFEASPQEIDEAIRFAKSHGDQRAHYAVVEGDCAYLKWFASALIEPDTVFLIGDLGCLHSIGCKVLDEGWSEGDPPLDLMSYISSVHTAEDSPQRVTDQQKVRQQMDPEKQRQTPPPATEDVTNVERPEGVSLPSPPPASPLPPAPPIPTNPPRVITPRPPNPPQPPKPPQPGRLRNTSNTTEAVRLGHHDHTPEPVERPKTVQRSADSEVMPLGTPPGPGENEWVVGSTGAGVDVPDEDIAARAREFLGGNEAVASDETEPSEAPSNGNGGVVAGRLVREAYTGVTGHVVEMRENGMALVEFEDSPEPSLVPVSELEPA